MSEIDNNDTDWDWRDELAMAGMVVIRKDTYNALIAERDTLRKQLESANNEVANLHKMLEIAETAIIAVTTDEEIEANKDLWTIEQVEETLRFARNEINRMREKTRREVQNE